jgi:hypothetical protein
MTRIIDNWHVTTETYDISAIREGVTVDMTPLGYEENRTPPEYIEVDAEQGSGYLCEHIMTRIPVEVMIALFEANGFTVTRNG